MQKTVFAIIGGIAAYVVLNVIVSKVSSDPQSAFFLLCPLGAAVLSDLWHARVSPILSALHLFAVYVPVVLMGFVQVMIAVATSGEFASVGWYLAGLAINLVVATVGFSASAAVRSMVFDYRFDADTAEPVSYRLAE